MIEAAASIAVLSLLCAIGFFALSSAGKGARQIWAELAAATRLIQAEALLRREFSQIEEPFWGPPDTIEIQANGARVGYFRGDPKAYVSVSEVEGFVLLSSPEGSWRLGPFGASKPSILKNAEDDPIGIRLEILMAGRTARVDSIFSAIALRGDKGP
jgi:hypothetical protein